MDFVNTIIKPIITEKTSEMQKDGKYTFKVGNKATKVQIAKMFELMYGTKVQSVRIMVVNKKARLIKNNREFVKRPTHKKAIITIKKGEKPVDINQIKLVSKK